MMGDEGNKLLKDIVRFQCNQRGDTQLRIERELRAEEQRKSQDQFQKFQEKQRNVQEAMMQYMMSLSQTVAHCGIPVPPPPPFFNSQIPPSSSQS
ncbi:hypothetical protein OROHE_026934 [Orobanche hederae]